MNVILCIILAGIFPSGISNLKPNIREQLDMTSLDEDAHDKEETAPRDSDGQGAENADTNRPGQRAEQMSVDHGPATKTPGHYSKDTRQYVFTSQNSLGDHQLTVNAATELNFAVKNYKVSTTRDTTEQTSPEEHSSQPSHKNKQKSTPNASSLWTMLAKAVNGTTVSMTEKDRLFQPIPSSDVSTSEDSLSTIEDIKLKLLIVITLMALIIFVFLSAFCVATLFKLKDLSYRSDSEYPTNPELATLPYFHRRRGTSDTSLSMSARSSSFGDTAPSKLRKSILRMSKSKYTTDVISISSDGTGLNDESDLLTSAEPSKETDTDN